MSAELIPFDFDSHAVRTVVVDGQPCFVAVDACRVLEHTNSRQALRRLDEDQRGYANVYTLGGYQQLAYVTESGLYALILTSRKPQAKRFRKWVTGEVLPALRRNGYYGHIADGNDLPAKRAHYQALPDTAQARAEMAVAALERVEAAIETGEGVSRAVEAVAQELGLTPRTIWNWRRTVYMVARPDWPAALARKSTKRGMISACHPEVLPCFRRLADTGLKITDCYRRLQEIAAQNGWEPVPPIHTLRRALKSGEGVRGVLR